MYGNPGCFNDSHASRKESDMFHRFPLIVALAVAGLSASAFAGNSSNHSNNNSKSCKTTSHKKSGFSFKINVGHNNRSNNYSNNSHHNHRKYVRAHWETYRVRYCVKETYYTVVTYPAVHEVRYDNCGKPYRVCVREEYRRRVLVPAEYGYRTGRRYVQGRWVTCSR